MNEPNRFFRIINYINSLFILIFFVTISVILLDKIISEYPWKNKQNTETISEKDKVKSKPINLTIGRIQQVHGLPIQILSLLDNRSPAKGAAYISKGASAHNILFLLKDFKEAHWLFPNHDFLITDFKQIPEQNESQKTNSDQITLAIFYRVVKQDSNGDGMLSKSDREVAAISKPDGSRYVEVISDADSIIDNKSVNHDTELAVLFEKDGKIRYQTFSLDNFSKTSEEILTEIPIDR